MKRLAALFLASLFIVSMAAAARADQSADDQKANDLLKQTRTATLAVHSLTADISESQSQGGKTVQKTGSVKLLKSNYLMEELWAGASHDASTPHEILASDGQSYWQIADDGTSHKEPASPDGTNIGNTDFISSPGLPDMASFISLFFNPTLIPSVDPTATITIVPETWNGGTYQVISQATQAKDPSGKQATITAKLYIGQDNLVHRLSLNITTMGSLDMQLLNIKTNALLTKADFAFAPPSWAKPAQ